MKRAIEAVRKFDKWLHNKSEKYELLHHWELAIDTFAFGLWALFTFVEFTMWPALNVHIQLVKVPLDWFEAIYWAWPLMQFSLTLVGSAGLLVVFVKVVHKAYTPDMDYQNEKEEMLDLVDEYYNRRVGEHEKATP